ncbi:MULTISPECIES: ribonuclease H family protein [Bacillaceae]|uniref:Ribonuclease H family protein n=1 Tax=Evansella alkalicola TaxID=745819 RepID=A0ABS6JSE8_9BACI|nr:MULTISPECIES: ribonuclease H family protein [Bacillaceae]MBU9721494.1 ribonuclease H family protein [Bacillus alkalicola]
MKVWIEFTYKTPKGLESKFSSDVLSAELALSIANDIQKTGRLKNIHFVDTKETTWSMKELNKLLSAVETEPHNITMYFDGGFDNETFESGLGCAIYYEKNGKALRLRINQKTNNLDNNNEAEYAALYFGLIQLENLGVHHLPVQFIGDSQVVINQLLGEWPCMEEVLNKWADRVEDKMKQLGISPEYELVSRKKNQEADQLASQALNNIEIESTIELEQKN